MPPAWAHIRAAVLLRDGHRCTHTSMLNGRTFRCKARRNLEVDHVGDHDDHTMANLTTLCHSHHANKTGKDARALQLSRGVRPAVVHHGMRNVNKNSIENVSKNLFEND